MTQATRKIVRIDPDRCDGCGLCVPSCAEGAIQIKDGKARLVGENLCDGLGNCLGQCPRDAITIEERPAEAFDEQAVQQHQTAGQPNMAGQARATQTAHAGHACPGGAAMGFGERPGGAAMGFGDRPGGAAMGLGGCPGSASRMLRQPPQPTAARQGAADQPSAVTADVTASAAADQPSELRHWPVQLTLVPPSGPMWDHAHVLLAADCVSFAMAGFHQHLLAGHSLAIACPKLDDVGPYVHKLAGIFANAIESVTVAHMEVPCCHSLLRVVRAAMELSGKTDLPLRVVVIGLDGTIKSDQTTRSNH